MLINGRQRGKEERWRGVEGLAWKMEAKAFWLMREMEKEREKEIETRSTSSSKHEVILTRERERGGGQGGAAS